jgi:cob(I)alamin adenosyltransferase
MMKGSISTKTGDSGTTDLIGGKRVPKDHPLIECLGTIDELNSFLGAAKAALGAEDQRAGGGDKTFDIIEGIQKDLFVLAGILAGSASPAPDERRLGALIGDLEAGQQPFRSFAVPGANVVSAQLHIARSVCRRAERSLVSLSRSEGIPPGVLPYFNRLSDLLFLRAQKEAGETGI